MTTRIAQLASFVSLLVAASVSAQPPAVEPQGEAAESSARTITVVKLNYADAEYVASVLSEVLPPTVKVVAYYPTNSLIISGDPAVVGEVAASVADERP